jgi:hypothetical protein
MFGRKRQCYFEEKGWDSMRRPLTYGKLSHSMFFGLRGEHLFFCTHPCKVVVSGVCRVMIITKVEED